MPTGYTAALYDGDQEFKDFALSAARAFLISLRDSTGDIPEVFEPSSFNQNRLDEATARLDELRRLPADQCSYRAAAEYAAWEEQRQASAAEEEARRARFVAMVGQVERWAPPTNQHVELRRFMLEQLATETKYYDAAPYVSEPPPTDGAAWREAGIDRAIREIAYCKEQVRKEQERAAHQTAWVQALRESLA